MPDPEPLEHAKRRSFTAKYKLEILAMVPRDATCELRGRRERRTT